MNLVLLRCTSLSYSYLLLLECSFRRSRHIAEVPDHIVPWCAKIPQHAERNFLSGEECEKKRVRHTRTYLYTDINLLCPHDRISALHSLTQRGGIFARPWTADLLGKVTRSVIRRSGIFSYRSSRREEWRKSFFPEMDDMTGHDDR
jgi:hypothetical protein